MDDSGLESLLLGSSLNPVKNQLHLMNRILPSVYERKVKVLVACSCPTLCDPMDCSLSGSSVHGILQAKILEWVARPFSRGSFQLRDRTLVSCIAGGFFMVEPLRKPTDNS